MSQEPSRNSSEALVQMDFVFLLSAWLFLEKRGGVPEMGMKPGDIGPLIEALKISNRGSKGLYSRL